jgi:tRNA1(Val) A37 N6-methylase TrmN6
MKAIPLSSKDVFADMGCGKGRCLIMATQYEFRKVIGVEYNETLFQILMHNIEPISRNV